MGSSISRIDMWEHAAHLSRLGELHAAIDYTRAHAFPEESPLGRSQRLDTIHAHRVGARHGVPLQAWRSPPYTKLARRRPPLIRT